MRKPPKYPELYDWLLQPMKWEHPDHIRGMLPTLDQILNNYIFDSPEQRLTFMGLDFGGIKESTNPNMLAAVVKPKESHRYEMHFNFKRLRRLWLETLFRRIARRPKMFEMPDLLQHYYPDFVMLTDLEKQDALRDTDVVFPSNKLHETDRFWLALPAMRQIGFHNISLGIDALNTRFCRLIKQVIRHEFGHVWFWHLKHNYDDCPEEIKPFLNVAQDGLINNWLGITIGHKHIQHADIKNPYVALLPILFPQMSMEYMSLLYGNKTREEVWDLWKSSVVTTTILKDGITNYELWRILASQYHCFRHASFDKLQTAVNEIRDMIRGYENTIIEIATKIAALFPKNETIKFTCINGEKGDETNVPIDDVPLADLPPQHKDISDAALSAAGMGADARAYILDCMEKILISQKTLQVLTSFTENDPARFVKRRLDKEVKDPYQMSYRPSKGISGKQLTLTNSLIKTDPPKFFKKRTVEELVAQKTLNLYVDVSGSFFSYAQHLLGFIYELRKTFLVRVFQFSTEVHPITETDLANRLLKTTGGTDGNAIYRHIRSLAESSTNFVVVGDREYGQLTEELGTLSFPKPITIIDVVIKQHRIRVHAPWFQNRENVTIESLVLDKSFNIICDT
jgi:hypothetical protein